MFKVHLHFIKLYGDIPFDRSLMLRIKKEHWHYPAVQRITSSILDNKHDIDIAEKSDSQPVFELQLVDLHSPRKATLYGCSVIKILQWPMERAKRDKIKLSQHIYLEIQLSYEYVSTELSTSSFQSGLQSIQIKQKIATAEDQNNYLKNSVAELTHRCSQLKERNSQLLQLKQKALSNSSGAQKDLTAIKTKISDEISKIKVQLEVANYKLTSLLNLICEKTDITTVALVHQILQNKQSE